MLKRLEAAEMLAASQSDPWNDDADPHSARVLLVDIPSALARSIPGVSGSSAIGVALASLNIRCLADVMPDVVISQLFGPGYDILDLAKRLTAMGYGGALRAVTAPLPDLDAVRAEVRDQCSGIDFDLITLG